MNLTETKVKTLRDFPFYDKNPFLENLKIPIVTKANMFLSKDKAIVNVLTGELDNDIIITGRRHYVDGEDFIKIYTKELRFLFDLSKATQKLLSYLLVKIGYNDSLIFNISECEKELGYSRPTIFKSLKELLTKEFLSRHIGVSYWINPKLFYKGDRLVIMREYVKAKKENLVGKNQTNLFEQVNQLNDKIEEIKIEKDFINP